jgi:hypothetical protein
MSHLTAAIRQPNYGLGIAKGLYWNISHVHKFGDVPAMSQNQTGTIWDVNDTNYPWSSWSSAGTLDIPSVNSSDNGLQVTLEGLDANYAVQSETVTVSSSATTTTTKSFIRLFSAYSDATNVANINIQKSAVTVARITAGKAQTLMAIYTVPAGHTAYLLNGTASCQSGADATGNMYVKYFGQDSFRVGHSFEVSGSGGQYMYNFEIPIKIPEKSDIDVRATVRSNNARITAAFDMILDND